MKLKDINKIFLCLLITSFFVIIIPSNEIVLATVVTQTENFDSYLNEQQVTGWLNTWSTSNSYYATTTIKYHSNYLGYKFFNSHGDIGFWNISSSGTSLDNLTFYIYAYSALPGYTGMTIRFYNIVNQQIFALQTLGGSRLLLDYLGSFYDLTGGISYFESALWDKITIKSVTYNTANVTLYNSTGAIRAWQTFGLTHMMNNFSYIKFESGGTSGWEGAYVIDDVTFKTGGTTPSISCDLSQYQYKGTNTAFSTSFHQNNFLHQLYRVPITTHIVGVELTIDPSMYNSGTYGIGANLSSYYYLFINGNFIGTATSIEPSGINYIVKWCNLSVSLNNETVLFEFEQDSKYNIYYGYWFVGQSSFLDDVDNDGTIQYSASNTFGYGGNIFYNDLAYKFYYDSFILVNTSSPYTDHITSTKNSFNTTDTVPIFYTISSFLYSNTIQLWKDGVQQYIQGFPYNVPTGTFKDELSFTPLYSGSYQLRLVRNSVIKSSFNFTVTDLSDMNFTIAVYPNPFKLNEKVIISYRFYTSDGNNGFIGVSEFSDTMNTSNFKYNIPISSNTSGNTTFYPQQSMYITLWKKIGSSYGLLITKYLKMYLLLDNTINVQYNNIQLSDTVTSVSQGIFGTHSLQGFKTFVSLNGQLIKYVTNEPIYNVYTIINKACAYTAQLCIETFNGTFVLCYINFTASSPSTGGTKPSSPIDIFGDYAYVFGVGIIVMFLLLPMTIASSLGIELPMIVNIGSGALGLSFCILSGFLPLWVGFLTVIAIIVAGIFVMFGR